MCIENQRNFFTKKLAHVLLIGIANVRLLTQPDNERDLPTRARRGVGNMAEQVETRGRVLSIQSHVVHGHVGNTSATFPLQVRAYGNHAASCQ